MSNPISYPSPTAWLEITNSRCSNVAASLRLAVYGNMQTIGKGHWSSSFVFDEFTRLYQPRDSHPAFKIALTQTRQLALETYDVELHNSYG